MPVIIFCLPEVLNSRSSSFESASAAMATILYIDDTENNRILVTRRLEKKGYRVVTAESAEQGLALVIAQRPDLILMDMGMPELDGWNATRQLKGDPKLRHIPVIALTAHA